MKRNQLEKLGGEKANLKNVDVNLLILEGDEDDDWLKFYDIF